MTSPQQGIQVTMADVYGHLHPYTKSRGNVLYEMMYSLTMDLKVSASFSSNPNPNPNPISDFPYNIMYHCTALTSLVVIINNYDNHFLSLHLPTIDQEWFVVS